MRDANLGGPRHRPVAGTAVLLRSPSSRRYASGFLACIVSARCCSNTIRRDPEGPASDPNSQLHVSRHPIKLAASMPKEPRSRPETHQSGECRNITDFSASPTAVPSSSPRNRKVYDLDVDRRAPARFALPFRTLAERHRARRQPSEVPAQPMHVSPSTDIAVTRERHQLIKTTTCGRRYVAALDLEPSCFNNPFGLQNSRHHVSERSLLPRAGPLSLLKSAVGTLNLERLSRSSSATAREWRQLSDSKPPSHRREGSRHRTRAHPRQGTTENGSPEQKTTTSHPLGPHQRSRQMRTRPAHALRSTC